MTPDLAQYMKGKRKAVDQALDGFLPAEDLPPETLHRAARYSVFAGGKRLRPILCLAACEAYRGSQELAMRAACALECIHTYSLIHDDLPAMDNDDLRRGKPTNHKVFGEAVAILAGDALLNLAFELLAWPQAEEDYRLRLLQLAAEIGSASGSRGMVGGQCADIEAEGRPPEAQALRFIHTHKTARLIAAALAAGAICADASGKSIARTREIGLDLGMAFQITDDILDIEGTAETLGKSAGKDKREHKTTYPALVGLEASKQQRESLLAGVEAGLDELLGDSGSRLKQLANLMVLRKA